MASIEDLTFKELMMGYEEKIVAVLEWADYHHSEFDAAFVLSVQEQLGDRGWLTDSQEDAIDNIIDRWRIEI